MTLTLSGAVFKYLIIRMVSAFFIGYGLGLFTLYLKKTAEQAR